ncbi:MAG: organomercurial lyase [Actinomycetota bacterium]|nr:organomercurial lyase [Actinomycetota bacterium]
MRGHRRPDPDPGHPDRRTARRTGRRGGVDRDATHQPRRDRQAVCTAQNFYRDTNAAAAWHAEHPQALLLPVAEASALYRQAALRVWPELQGG